MSVFLAFLGKYWSQIAIVGGAAILITWFHHSAYQQGWDVRDADWQADTAQRNKVAFDVEVKNRETERRWEDALQITQDQLAEATKATQTEVDRVIADTTADTLKLRERFRACSSKLSAASETTSGDNEASSGGLSKQDEGFLIRIAGEADQVVNKLTACQKLQAVQ